MTAHYIHTQAGRIMYVDIVFGPSLTWAQALRDSEVSPTRAQELGYSGMLQCSIRVDQAIDISYGASLC